MTTSDGWTRAVRDQLGLGRLLPLGDARDGAWIAERAAEGVLRRAAEEVGGVRLEALRIGLADPREARESAVPAPPSALPPGPLRVSAEVAAGAGEPLPDAAERLRAALAGAARARLGLRVAEVDLRITALLDEVPAPAAESRPEPVAAARPRGGDEERAAAAASSVPGVAGLTGALGGAGRAVHVDARRGEAALPRRHVRVEIAVGAGHRAVDVAREVRARVGEALVDRPSVAVLVTAVG